MSIHPLLLQEVQERAHAEVADVLERSGGKINHESVEGMSYTEAVINEALRMYAPVTNFVRKCMKDCEVNLRHLNHFYHISRYFLLNR